ncbi:MAG TPA: ATP-binding cassette domain-containing protein [Bryobacteraceae bacterium]|nr:ATP-binding cassette domain-containing protein [Bryobacteraceae bacterium]
MIQVDKLAKFFHDKKRGVVHALDHVSFEVKEREIFGLLGPNGAGKTTCLRLLATILKPTEGTATVGGADIVRSPEQVRRKIGFLSGDMGSYARLTPREVLAFFGKLNGLEGQKLRQGIDEMVRIFEFGEYANTKIDKLSTGMKQKVAIARTVLHDPPILILDEPSAGLDVPTARLIENFILQAKESGKSIIFSTHVMEEAEYLCDRIGVVHQGKLAAIGTMDQLRELTGKQRLREIFLDLLDMSERGQGARA